MPWVSYTHISHTNSGKKDNATPLFDWGKYYEKDGTILMPISVQVHHSFVDGLHIGLFVSYGRGEATETSDIDTVVILDELSDVDIRVYNSMLDTLPHRELICGFLSGKN